MGKPPPKLPAGNASALRGISENFSFHASPDSFIASRLALLQREDPRLLEKRAVVRAKILNRNVAIVSSYRQIREVLEARSDEETLYAAAPAYHEFMAPFFPSPNLLLTDGRSHATMRASWNGLMQPLLEASEPAIKEIARRHLQSIQAGSLIDLYESMKILSWQLLLGVFLDMKPHQPEFSSIQNLQEDLLRGQFSLFPVRVNTFLWQSPRQKGINAREKLQDLLIKHVQNQRFSCPFNDNHSTSLREIADHLLLFTSSLAAKALASLMTALFLNLYVFRGEAAPQQSLAALASHCDSTAKRRQLLENILVETERLSPPIVGIMRRCMRDTVITFSGDDADAMIPRGWDVWCYFAGGGRDPATFGKTCESFNPYRSSPAQTTPQSLVFGAGQKTCLGQEFTRHVILAVAEACLDASIDMQGSVAALGVRGWLGWEKANPEAWAQDMKQLPTQHPSQPVTVAIVHSSRSSNPPN